jgi:hypothetical protein
MTVDPCAGGFMTSFLGAFFPRFESPSLFHALEPTIPPTTPPLAASWDGLGMYSISL